MKTTTQTNELHMSISLGIDLGTTNSVCSRYNTTGIVKILPNMDGDLLTPSAVSVASHPPAVGKTAKQDRLFYPKLYAEQFKRYMDKRTESGNPVAIVRSPDGTEFTLVGYPAVTLPGRYDLREHFPDFK